MKDLTGLQKTYMKRLSPIQKAIFTFNLLAVECKDVEERNVLMKIAKVCENASESEEPLLQAGRNLSLMLAIEDLTIDGKSSVLSAIEVLERIKENYIVKNN